MLGTFGSCISGIQALVLERDQWWGRGSSGPQGEEEGQQQGSGGGWGPAQVAAMAGFAVSLYLFYVLVPRCVCQNWISISSLAAQIAHPGKLIECSTPCSIPNANVSLPLTLSAS